MYSYKEWHVDHIRAAKLIREGNWAESREVLENASFYARDPDIHRYISGMRQVVDIILSKERENDNG